MAAFHSYDAALLACTALHSIANNYITDLNTAAVVGCPVDASFLHAEAEVHGDTIKETLYIRITGE
jgi:hypothetical protein